MYQNMCIQCIGLCGILTHWGRVTHICVGKLTIIDSDNGLSPRRRQAIIWTNVGILLIEPLGTNFSEILIGIQIFSFTKMRLKMSSAKWRPFCLSLNVLKQFWNCNFQTHVTDWYHEYLPVQVMAWCCQAPPEPLLIQINVAIWHH